MRVRRTQLLRGKPRGAAERCTVASLECEAVQVDGHVDIEHSHVCTQFEAAILQPIAEAPEDHIKVRILFNRFSPCSPIFGMNGCVYGVGFPKVKSRGVWFQHGARGFSTHSLQVWTDEGGAFCMHLWRGFQSVGE